MENLEQIKNMMISHFNNNADTVRDFSRYSAEEVDETIIAALKCLIKEWMLPDDLKEIDKILKSQSRNTTPTEDYLKFTEFQINEITSKIGIPKDLFSPTTTIMNIHNFWILFLNSRAENVVLISPRIRHI